MTVVSYEIARRWMPLDFTDVESTLVQVMAWRRQATSHYLTQCWPRSMSPNDVTRPQWVKSHCQALADTSSLDFTNLFEISGLSCEINLDIMSFEIHQFFCSTFQTFAYIFISKHLSSMIMNMEGICYIFLLNPQLKYVSQILIGWNYEFIWYLTNLMG